MELSWVLSPGSQMAALGVGQRCGLVGGPTRRDGFHAGLGCGQKSVPCSCRAESFSFLLGVGQKPLSATRGHLQSLPHGFPQHSRSPPPSHQRRTKKSPARWVLPSHLIQSRTHHHTPVTFAVFSWWNRVTGPAQPQ